MGSQERGGGLDRILSNSAFQGRQMVSEAFRYLPCGMGVEVGRDLGGRGLSLLLHIEEPRLREIEPLIQALPALGAEDLNGI